MTQPATFGTQQMRTGGELSTRALSRAFPSRHVCVVGPASSLLCGRMLLSTSRTPDRGEKPPRRLTLMVLARYLRLGTSWGQLGGGLPPAGVPYNRTALVDVLLHTVRHYREGWGGGRNFSGTSNFKYVELVSGCSSPSELPWCCVWGISC
jgi:hypothetical protein